MSLAQGSSGSRGADLIVRVRYQNPLPPPPFPPKLLTMTTSMDRFASFETLKAFEADREAPMTVDSQLGMPLLPGTNDLGYWLGERERYTRVPPDSHLHLDADDQALLVDPTVQPGQAAASSQQPAAVNGTPSGLKSKPSSVFLNKRSERFDSDASIKRDEPVSRMPKAEPADLADDLPPEDAEQARLDAILATFEAVRQPLQEVVHPSNRSRTAVKQYSVLPDDAVYANTFAIITFSDDPRRIDPANPNADSDALTQTALLRQVELPDEDPRVAYYLAPSEEAANMFRRKKWQKPRIDEGQTEDHIPEPVGMNFRCVRHYDPTTTRVSDNRDFVLTIDDGEVAEGSVEKGLAPPRAPGAYYAPIAMHQSLKVRRPRKGENSMDYGAEALKSGVEAWHSLEIMLGITADVMTQAEVQKRREAVARMSEP